MCAIRDGLLLPALDTPDRCFTPTSLPLSIPSLRSVFKPTSGTQKQQPAHNESQPLPPFRNKRVKTHAPTPVVLLLSIVVGLPASFRVTFFGTGRPFSELSGGALGVGSSCSSVCCRCSSSAGGALGAGCCCCSSAATATAAHNRSAATAAAAQEHFMA